MGLIQKAEGWLFKVAVKRVGAGVVGAVAGLLAAAPVQDVMSRAGIVADPEKTKEFLMGLFVAGVVWFHDWVRLTKLGQKLKL